MTSRLSRTYVLVSDGRRSACVPSLPTSLRVEAGTIARRTDKHSTVPVARPGTHGLGAEAAFSLPGDAFILWRLPSCLWDGWQRLGLPERQCWLRNSGERRERRERMEGAFSHRLITFSRHGTPPPKKTGFRITSHKAAPQTARSGAPGKKFLTLEIQ